MLSSPGKSAHGPYQGNMPTGQCCRKTCWMRRFLATSGKPSISLLSSNGLSSTSRRVISPHLSLALVLTAQTRMRVLHVVAETPQSFLAHLKEITYIERRPLK